MPQWNKIIIYQNFAKSRINFKKIKKSLIFIKAYDIFIIPNGGIAQLGERLNGIQEVMGSIPTISTKNEKEARSSDCCFFFIIDEKGIEPERVCRIEKQYSVLFFRQSGRSVTERLAFSRQAKQYATKSRMVDPHYLHQK